MSESNRGDGRMWTVAYTVWEDPDNRGKWKAVAPGTPVTAEGRTMQDCREALLRSLDTWMLNSRPIVITSNVGGAVLYDAMGRRTRQP